MARFPTSHVHRTVSVPPRAARRSTASDPSSCPFGPKKVAARAQDLGGSRPRSWRLAAKKVAARRSGAAEGGDPLDVVGAVEVGQREKHGRNPRVEEPRMTLA